MRSQRILQVRMLPCLDVHEPNRLGANRRKCFQLDKHPLRISIQQMSDWQTRVVAVA